MPEDIEKTLRDPAFLGLPDSEKHKVLLRVDPSYASLPGSEQQKVIGGLTPSLLNKPGPPLTGADLPPVVGQGLTEALPYLMGAAASFVPGGIFARTAAAAAFGGIGKATEEGLESMTRGPQALPPPPGQAINDIGKEAAIQGATQLGGEILGGVLGKVFGRFFKPKELYQSALRPPPSLGREEIEREVSTGLRESIPVSETGLAKAEALQKQIDAEVKAVIAGAPNAPVQPQAVSARLDALRQHVANSPNPQGYLDAIDSAEREFLLAHSVPKGTTVSVNKTIIDPNNPIVRGRPNYITVTENVPAEKLGLPELRALARPIPGQKAQSIKLRTWEEIRAQNPSVWIREQPPPLNIEAKMEIGSGLKEEIERLYGVGAMNAREGDVIQLRRSIDRFVAREGNLRVLPYFWPLIAVATGAGAHAGGQHMMGAGLDVAAVALMRTALENPDVKSKLAILMYHAGAKVPDAAKAFMRGTTTLPNLTRAAEYYLRSSDTQPTAPPPPPRE